MKIAIIGAGNIGGAMARGLMAGKVVYPSDLTLTASRESSLEKYVSLGCNLTTDNVAAVKTADLVVLALKTEKMMEVVGQIRNSLDHGRQIVVSMAAGVEDEALKIVRQTVVGAMGLLKAHGSHPEAEIDKVTTPGGITIKGLTAMEKEGFSTAVIEGLKAAKK